MDSPTQRFFKLVTMMNQYEYTRAIKFRLGEGNILFSNHSVGEDIASNVFNDFKISYFNLLDTFKRAVFTKGEKESVLRVNPRLEVKYPWLRQYAREEFYALNPNHKFLKKYTIVEARFLKDIFSHWFERNNILKKEIDEVFSRPQENKAKRSDIALLIRRLYGADYLFFVRDLLKYANDKDSDQNLYRLKASLLETENLTERINSILAPDQSQGIEVARGSFNYYTINKISKNFDKDIEIQNEQLNKSYNGSFDINLLTNVKFNDYISPKEINNLSIEELYASLKEFRSQQETAFIQAIQKGESVHVISSKFPLFSNPRDRDVVQKFSSSSNKKRSEYFQNKWGFNKYVEYCNIYKRVAMARGRIKAQIRAIEQEKIESRLLRYWAHIILYPLSRQ